MSIKNNVVAAVLLVALTGTLASCGGGDKVVEAGKDATGKAMEAGKDVTGKAMEAGKDATGKAMEAGKGAVKSAAGVGAAAGLAPLIVQVKGPLVQASGDLKAGKMEKVKENFGKFKSAWDTVGPQIKPLAGDKYAALDAGVTKLSTVMGGASIDKTKATGALDGVIKTMNDLGVMKK
jgi:hypothetical protein